jgi:hypothetical protein
MFKKLFIKRIAFRVDDQIKAMNDEIFNIEREYKLRLTRPSKSLRNFKRHFRKDEIISNRNIEIDENKINEEKKEKVN